MDMVIAQMHSDGWWLGLGIGVAVVVVVVLVVVAILRLAGRIATQARTGIQAMDQARLNTLPVWAVQDINKAATGIWRATERARKILGG